ncbi:hypothetical protein [Thalassospira lucentensis]|uniref:hypothetical protein n=1 Tax=Thalassospira lucentensis TaxID=168935 RepID=UPI002943B27B|nr:hypothetical protein [Thalassospira lucentensis]WOI11614.1 hypothetical protein R1T41_03305 [Thalassospira lucentensis]
MIDEKEKLTDYDHYAISRVDTVQNWRMDVLSHTHTIANDSIKSLILLNGGTIPALATLKSLSPAPEIQGLFAAVALFMLGLLFALFAQLSMHISLRMMGRHFDAVTSDFIDAYRAYRKGGDKSSNAKVFEERTDQSLLNEAKEKKWNQRARISTFLSLLSFIIGAFVAMYAFYPAAS